MGAFLRPNLFNNLHLTTFYLHIMFNLMKTVKEIMNEANVSRWTIYKRIAKLEEMKGNDYKPEYSQNGNIPERVFPDDQAEWLINAAKPIGRPKKVYREE